MSFANTYTGRIFDYHALAEGEPVDICLEDIAHSLAHICRFNGHCRSFYSVAEHSVWVSRVAAHGLLDKRGHSRAGLLHDAHEAYTGDMLAPLQWALAGRLDAWKDLCKDVELRILETLAPGLTDAEELWGDVKRADLAVLALELDVMMSGKRNAIDLPAPATGVRILFLEPERAKSLLLEECRHWGITNSGSNTP